MKFWTDFVENNVQDSLCTVQLTDRKTKVQDRLRIGLMMYSTADEQDVMRRTAYVSGTMIWTSHVLYVQLTDRKL
jgi:hypothetical protein